MLPPTIPNTYLFINAVALALLAAPSYLATFILADTMFSQILCFRIYVIFINVTFHLSFKVQRHIGYREITLRYSEKDG